MFLVIVLVLMVAYRTHDTTPPLEELWFMAGVFLALAYVAGYLDSRLFAKFDQKNANRLAEAEARYGEETQTDLFAE